MRVFHSPVDKRSKDKCLKFLSYHDKYKDVPGTTYSQNVKIPRLQLDAEVEKHLFDLMVYNFENRDLEFHDLIQRKQEEFAKNHGYYPYFVGRNDSHIVLVMSCFVDGKWNILPDLWYEVEASEKSSMEEIRYETQMIEAFDKWTDELLSEIIQFINERYI